MTIAMPEAVFDLGFRPHLVKTLPIVMLRLSILVPNCEEFVLCSCRKNNAQINRSDGEVTAQLYKSIILIFNTISNSQTTRKFFSIGKSTATRDTAATITHFHGQNTHSKKSARLFRTLIAVSYTSQEKSENILTPA
jgi:hypothetical protein